MQGVFKKLPFRVFLFSNFLFESITRCLHFSSSIFDIFVGDILEGLADVIKLLSGLFSGDPIPCEDACDGNDDELLDIADAIKLLSVLFSGDTPPPGAGTCSPDPAGTALDCVSFPPCE